MMARCMRRNVRDGPDYWLKVFVTKGAANGHNFENTGKMLDPSDLYHLF